MPFVQTGLLTLIQAIDYLIETQEPDLRVKILSESLELHALPPAVSRAPAPIRPVGQRGGWHGPPQRSAPIDAKAAAQMEARERLRVRLQEDLRKNRATWAAERERAIARLGQAFCDAAVPTWLLMETTGERIPLPASRWSTKEGVAAFQSGSYTLITAAGIIKGTVVVLVADLDRWLASEGASWISSRAAADAPEQDDRVSIAPVEEAPAKPPPRPGPRARANKSGRKPEKFDAAVNEMVDAVNHSKLTRDELAEIPKKNLTQHFRSAKETTLFHARDAALEQLDGKGNS